jgi:HAMP domain-containing protein
VTAGPDPLPLRARLRELSDLRDESAAGHLAHRMEHGCREGQCPAGTELARLAGAAEHDLQMTRFLNDAD